MQVIIWDLTEQAEKTVAQLEEAHAMYVDAANQTAAAIVAVKAAVKAQENIRMGKKPDRNPILDVDDQPSGGG